MPEAQRRRHGRGIGKRQVPSSPRGLLAFDRADGAAMVSPSLPWTAT
jgi:hypothetical protein